ncbi:MAG TPA: hypothetical protein VMV45_02200 [Casimicrobiaceae bacterium]|nr:hypothetical protein [Casimicrobiaceae bacterium]
MEGSAVTITETADGKAFVNWTGACSGTLPTCPLNVTKDVSVQAVFTK